MVDKAITFAAKVTAASYGELFCGFASGTRVRVPILCAPDGACYSPDVSTDTTAGGAFTSANVSDHLGIKGFVLVKPADQGAKP